MATGVSQEIDEAAPDMVSQLFGMGAILALMVVGGGVLIWWYARTRARRGTPVRHYRLAHFAAQNGLTYLPGPYKGTHVTPWKDRGLLVLTRVMHPLADRSIEFANYELIHGTARNRNTQFGGYCALRLRSALPHIVLQSRHNRTPVITSAALPARAQQLSLEGDFDQHFTLFCPEGYERDALYLFTPDVMARLVDRVRGFDVEIIDDWLFLVDHRDLVTLDPERWLGVADAVGALRDKVGRWERWRDDREAPVVQGGGAMTAGQPVVAAPGQRLRLSSLRATLIWAIPTAAVFVAIVLANVLPF
ncbi:hypothetical protein [Herbiconiux liukaitaii]|uniref:hypothetical protein n=1 Tax=Herbiconiux liukaitaii TaxID=3342799 RepID=UPI0035B7C84E